MRQQSAGFILIVNNQSQFIVRANHDLPRKHHQGDFQTPLAGLQFG